MEKILNERVVVFPFLIGNRYYNDRDFEEFSINFSAKCCYQPLFCDYLGRKNNRFKKILERVEKQVTGLIGKENEPIVIVPILTMVAAKEAKRLIDCFERLRAIRDNVYVYPIIWDGYNSCYLYNSGGAVYIFIDSDYPSSGARRLTEYIRRIMGYDLLDNSFPGYSQGDASKIAKHINHENFNTFSRKSGAIPKYSIVNGKPYFPVLYVEVKCPHCGHKNEVYRGRLDEKGGAEVMCYKCYEKTYLESIGKEFDPWPECEEYQMQSARNNTPF